MKKITFILIGLLFLYFVVNYRLFIVLSSSMHPTIKAYDLIIVKNIDEYKVGDVITYKHDNTYITHRIVSISDKYITTIGDSNNIEDYPIDKDNVVGKIVFNLGNFNRLFVVLIILIILSGIKSIKKYIAILLIFFIPSITYSKFISYKNIYTSVKVAKPIVKLNVIDNNDRISPFKNKIVEFNVCNYEEDEISDVIMKYIIKFEIQNTSIPMELKLFDSDDNEIPLDKNLTTGYFEISNKYKEVHNYKLIISMYDNNSSFNNLNDILSININSIQKGNI